MSSGPQDRPLFALLLVVATITAWSAVGALDYPTWFFELLLGVVLVLTMVALRRQFPFSTWVCVVVAIHYVVLAIGAKYTYAEAPPGEWMQSLFGFSRNHFDRVGHFLQGVTPALVMREVLLRRTRLGRGVWLGFCSVSVALAFSALYEILEWLWVAAFYPDSGPEWLGMQGDPFDAQADMLMALLGGLLFAVVLRGVHDRSLTRLLGKE